MYKLLITIIFLSLSKQVMSYDVTKGALQNDPSLCAYGYNPNCGQSTGGYSTGGGFFPPTSYTPDVPRVQNWGAVAYSDTSKMIESFAYSKWNTSKKMAENDAKEKCENKTKTPCKVIASYTKTCATGIQGYDNKSDVLFVATTPDAIDQGFAACKKKGYKNCKVVFNSCAF
nr:DUF4189 domain-containing protein [uncultured Kingella sp.]